MHALPEESRTAALVVPLHLLAHYEAQTVLQSLKGTVRVTVCEFDLGLQIKRTHSLCHSLQYGVPLRKVSVESAPLCQWSAGCERGAKHGIAYGHA